MGVLPFLLTVVSSMQDWYMSPIFCSTGVRLGLSAESFSRILCRNWRLYSANSLKRPSAPGREEWDYSCATCHMHTDRSPGMDQLSCPWRPDRKTWAVWLSFQQLLFSPRKPQQILSRVFSSERCRFERQQLPLSLQGTVKFVSKA